MENRDLAKEAKVVICTTMLRTDREGENPASTHAC
jgi:hypothetical protein